MNNKIIIKTLFLSILLLINSCSDDSGNNDLTNSSFPRITIEDAILLENGLVYNASDLSAAKGARHLQTFVPLNELLGCNTQYLDNQGNFISNTCTTRTLPLIGQVFQGNQNITNPVKPTVQEILNRVVVEEQWVVNEFEELLNSMPDATMELFNSVAVVFVLRGNKSTFYVPEASAIYFNAGLLLLPSFDQVEDPPFPPMPRPTTPYPGNLIVPQNRLDVEERAVPGMHVLTTYRDTLTSSRLLFDSGPFTTTYGLGKASLLTALASANNYYPREKIVQLRLKSNDGLDLNYTSNVIENLGLPYASSIALEFADATPASADPDIDPFSVLIEPYQTRQSTLLNEAHPLTGDEDLTVIASDFFNNVTEQSNKLRLELFLEYFEPHAQLNTELMSLAQQEAIKKVLATELRDLAAQRSLGIGKQLTEQAHLGVLIESELLELVLQEKLDETAVQPLMDLSLQVAVVKELRDPLIAQMMLQIEDLKESILALVRNEEQMANGHAVTELRVEINTLQAEEIIQNILSDLVTELLRAVLIEERVDEINLMLVDEWNYQITAKLLLEEIRKSTRRTFNLFSEGNGTGLRSYLDQDEDYALLFSDAASFFYLDLVRETLFFAHNNVANHSCRTAPVPLISGGTSRRIFINPTKSRAHYAFRSVFPGTVANELLIRLDEQPGEVVFGANRNICEL